MVAENPTRGAPRIHGELLMLGFDVSERTISRWMRRALRDPEPAKRRLAFLRNHREATANLFATITKNGRTLAWTKRLPKKGLASWVVGQ